MVCNGARIRFVDGSKFLLGLKHENTCYALIPRKRNGGNTKITNTKGAEVPQREVKELLEYFQEQVCRTMQHTK